jgi:hypothetical protein
MERLLQWADENGLAVGAAAKPKLLPTSTLDRLFL